MCVCVCIQYIQTDDNMAQIKISSSLNMATERGWIVSFEAQQRWVEPSRGKTTEPLEPDATPVTAPADFSFQ